MFGLIIKILKDSKGNLPCLLIYIGGDISNWKEVDIDTCVWLVMCPDKLGNEILKQRKVHY